MLVLGSPAAAQQPPLDELWGGLRPGMSKEEVKARYPTGKVSISPKCVAKITAKYKQGRLQLVLLSNDIYDRQRCGEIVRASMIAKYGEPLKRQTGYDENTCGNTSADGIAGKIARACEKARLDRPTYYALLGWRRGNTEIYLKREEHSEDIWTLLYRPADDVAPEASGAL